MKTRTPLTTAVLAALALACLPLRADDAAFSLELEAALQEITHNAESRARRRPRSIMAKDLHALVIDVANELLVRNEQLRAEKVPVDERLPTLRQLYFTEMRKIHELEPDGNSSVKYNEWNQTLMFYYYEISSSGGFSGGGGGGTFAGRIGSLLEFHMMERDPFAHNLRTELSRLESDWRSFLHANFGFLHSHGRGRPSAGSSMIPSFMSGLFPASASISPLKYPRGIASMVQDIGYELSKLDVELSLEGKSDEERAEELRGKLIEVIWEFDKLTPLVEFDEDAAEFLFFDSSGGRKLDAAGAPLTYKIPSSLLSALNMNTANDGLNSRMRRLMIGAGAVLLLLFGGIYLAMKFSSSQEENESAESE